jgi:hypothetical protein
MESKLPVMVGYMSGSMFRFGKKQLDECDENQEM